MHERDLEQRPQWSQGAVDAIVRAQLWIRDHRKQTAEILARESGNAYTPHTLPVLSKVLVPNDKDAAGYLASRAIRHPGWNEERIDFQPYPYPSYTEALVDRLKKTVVEGKSGFLETLDPVQAATDLVDDRFVKRAIDSLGGPEKFGIDGSYQRQEMIAI
jgi:NitT/TauT family transport system substrate-binding protein